MSLTENGNGMVMPVGPMYGNGYGGIADGGIWWLFIIFVIAMMGGNWGGFGGNQAGNADMQRAFDQQASMNAIGDVNNAINGLNTQFLNCCCENRLATANLGSLVAQEGAATRANTDAKVQTVLDKLCQLEMDGIKRDYENRISGMQNQIDALRTQVTNQGFLASQNAQTAAIMADNAAQTTALEQYLNPTPIPAYPVQNPNCCGGNRFGFAG